MATTLPTTTQDQARLLDDWLLWGTFATAMAVLAVLVTSPVVFPLLYLINLWVLGYPHVVSTFTRFRNEPELAGRDRFLLQLLPLFSVGVVLAALLGVGSWLVVTVYFYWQWFHTMRQGFGLARIYQHKEAPFSRYYDTLTTLVIYAIPTWGVLHRSFQAQDGFLYMKLKYLPVSATVVEAAAWISAALLLLWAVEQVRMLIKGQFPWRHSAFVGTHLLIFAIGYLWMPDVSHGFLVTNVWHNTQYLLFVWIANLKLGEAAPPSIVHVFRQLAPDRRFMHFYFLCIALSTGVYLSIVWVHTWLLVVPFAMLMSQAINVHHFITDGFIWKRRQKAVEAATAN